MGVSFLDLKAEYNSIKPEIDAAVNAVISSGIFIGGSIIEEFEEQFSAYVGTDFCVSCANGTDALEVVLKSLGIGEGDEVIVPAMSWISTASAVNNVGAEPVFVDVLAGEYTINPALIESSLTDKTKAIIPVHIYGLPARMKDILDIARTHGLKVVEDCAQSHGANIEGRKVGTFGDAATFSFYPSKNLGAYGDAGAILTDDSLLAGRIREICNYGQKERHDHQTHGRNSRMDSMQAAILKVKLSYLDDWNECRNKNASAYHQLLDEHIMFQQIPEGYSHVFHLFVIESKNRDLLIKVFNDHNVGYGLHYPTALPLLPVYSYTLDESKKFPVAERISHEGISIPVFHTLQMDQIEPVAKLVNLHSK